MSNARGKIRVTICRGLVYHDRRAEHGLNLGRDAKPERCMKQFYGHGWGFGRAVVSGLLLEPLHAAMAHMIAIRAIDAGRHHEQGGVRAC